MKNSVLSLRSHVLLTASFLAVFQYGAMAADAPKPPPADEVMTEIGLSDGDKKKVLAGEYVTSEVDPVSERDLSVGVTFVVQATPDEIAKDVASGSMIAGDPQVKMSGAFREGGTQMDLSRLRLDQETAATFGSAAPGSTLNLSAAEYAEFAKSGPASFPASRALQDILLARFQAYKTSGLGGIAPYDRGGSSSDVAGDLRKASQSLANLKKYMPQLSALLESYPGGSVPGMQETFHWVEYVIDGTPTFVIVHGIVAPLADARVIVQRQLYVSAGYNAEQAVAVLLPVKEGTVVVYRNHTFTEQVAGFGGSAKRTIGRGIMTKKLEALFEKQKKIVAQ